MIHASLRAQNATRVPLRLSDLVREVDREPRIPDLTLGERLSFAKPQNVRKLITRNRDELELHGALVERSGTFLHGGENPKVGASSDLRTPAAARTRGGRPSTMWFLNEGQALVVCALARTPIAIKVRQDVIAVYMAHRRGGDFVTTSERERSAVRFLIEHGHVIRADVPQPCHGTRTGYVKCLFVSPVTKAVLATLAEFDAGDERESVDGNPRGWGGSHNPDLEPDNDDEQPLGWSENVSQLALTASEDGEASLGWDNEDSQRLLHASPDEREADVGDQREHDIDSKESDVGSCDGNASQLRWGVESNLITSMQGDSEPSLGWPENAGAGFRNGFEGVRLATMEGEGEDGHDNEAGADDDLGVDDRSCDDDEVDADGEFLGGTVYGADAEETGAGCEWEGRTGERA